MSGESQRPKTPEEIRQRLDRLKVERFEHRRCHRHIDASAASIEIGALVWTLGETASPTERSEWQR